MRVFTAILWFTLICDTQSIWWVIGRKAIFRASHVCRKARRLQRPEEHARIQRLCRYHRQLLRVTLEGIQYGIEECQFQMRYNRWNCSSSKRDLGKLLQHATREAAFVQSMTAAGSIHRLAQACSRGEVTECNCAAPVVQSTSGMRMPPPGQHFKKSREQFLIQGCGDNLHEARKLAEKLTDISFSRQGTDFRNEVYLHNNGVGRTAVFQHEFTKCKCHGISGSCDLKTCWRRVPHFRQIGEALKEHMTKAIRVIPANDGSKKLWPADREIGGAALSSRHHQYRRSSMDSALFFMDSSPDFCLPNRRLGISGVKGRECNATLANCNVLCCGKGYTVTKEDFESYCDCQFTWCCEVTCYPCRKTRIMHHCN